jgi:hypothetical protein
MFNNELFDVKLIVSFAASFVKAGLGREWAGNPGGAGCDYLSGKEL